MNQIKCKVLSDILELMARSHAGKQGGGYGCLRSAAKMAVDEFGEGWIAPQRGYLKDKDLHDFFVRAIKLTSPPGSNAYRTKQKFFEYAQEHADTLSLTQKNLQHLKLNPTNLLAQLE